MKNIVADVSVHDARKLLVACCVMAPNEDAEAGFDELFSSMLVDHAEPVDIVKALARALLDGLDHGNWPNPVAPIPTVTEHTSVMGAMREAYAKPDKKL